uniref:Uncharacterized protein n=1 Tax=Zea mays TaxID=4577 RepID=C4J1D1_MAIZE|nr:unknown [Zea mays]
MNHLIHPHRNTPGKNIQIAYVISAQPCRPSKSELQAPKPSTEPKAKIKYDLCSETSHT